MNTAKKHITVYYRVGCHLCEQMTAALHLLQDELNFEIESIDIDRVEDEQLRLRYHVDIPVLEYQGEVLCYHFFDEIALRQALLDD